MEELILGATVWTIIQAATLLFVPVMTFAAALRLRGCVPGWITTTMLIASVCNLLAGFPGIAMLTAPFINQLDVAPEQMSLIFMFVGMVNTLSAGAIAIAVFALAGRVRHTAMMLAESRTS